MTVRSESWRVTLTSGGQYVATLPVVDGQITADIGQSPTRVATLTVPGLDQYVPKVSTDMLDPRRRLELTVEHGIGTPGGNTVWYPLGVFVLTQTSIDRKPDGTALTVTCPDRSQVVKQALLTAPVAITAGTSVSTAVASILATQAPWLPQRITATSASLPAAWAGNPADDPWSVCEGFAQAAASELLIDVTGAAVLRPMTTPLASDVAATWATGPGGTVTEIKRDLDASDAPDAVVVVWSGGVSVIGSTATGARRAKWDGDQSLITTADQAQTVGQAWLLLHRGLAEQVTVQVWSDPTLDVGAVVHVIDAGSGTDTTARILSMSRQMTDATMSATLATRRLA